MRVLLVPPDFPLQGQVLSPAAPVQQDPMQVQEVPRRAPCAPVGPTVAVLERWPRRCACHALVGIRPTAAGSIDVSACVAVAFSRPVSQQPRVGSTPVTVADCEPLGCSWGRTGALKRWDGVCRMPAWFIRQSRALRILSKLDEWRWSNLSRISWCSSAQISFGMGRRYCCHSECIVCGKCGISF